MLTPTVENILAVYRAARPEQRAEGMNWYTAAHNLAVELDPRDPSQSAGVIAALSPMMPWGRNERLAIMCYEDPESIRNGGLKGNMDKAIRIRNGEPAAQVIKGDKVSAFWRSIADPTNPDISPVIDRHAHDIAVGQRCENDDRNLGKRRYIQFANCYKDAALFARIGAAQMQAVTWVVWREAIGISY